MIPLGSLRGIFVGPEFSLHGNWLVHTTVWTDSIQGFSVITVVPEPRSAHLLACSLGALAVASRSIGRWRAATSEGANPRRPRSTPDAKQLEYKELVA